MRSMFLRHVISAIKSHGSGPHQVQSAQAARELHSGNISSLVSLRAWHAPEQAQAGASRVSACSARREAAVTASQQRGIATSAIFREKVPLVAKTPPMGANRAEPAAAASSVAAQQHTAQQQPQPAQSAAAAPQGLAAAPSVARTLGFAGAIPFIALSPPIAQVLPLMPADLVANAALLQLGYGASIASFLGGIHWAMAMSGYGGRALSGAHETERYLWSVTPCLMAWPAVTLAPGPGSLIVGATLGIVYAVDNSFAAKGLLPSWYMSLRLPLTLAAVGGMMCTLAGSLLYGIGDKKASRER